MFDSQRLALYPESPGVYLMKDLDGRVLYVGKAKDIRARLKQYFSLQDKRIQVPLLLAKVADIETIQTLSEQEALLLEFSLIQKFRPKYNVMLKDGRGGCFLVIDLSHPTPGLTMLREAPPIGEMVKVFGPFASARIAQEAFDLVVDLFSLRQCSDEVFKKANSPCLLYQMGRCVTPCAQKGLQSEYLARVNGAVRFLSGETSGVKARLVKQMNEEIERLEFEKAEEAYKKLQALEAIDGLRTKRARLSEVDVIGIGQDERRIAVSLMQYRSGAPVHGESWIFSSEVFGSIFECVEQILVQYYLQKTSGEGLPKEVLLPNGTDATALGELLQKSCSKRLLVRCGVLGKKKALVALACDNALAALHQRPKKEGVSEILESLRQLLDFRRVPKVIDCFDASHFGGKNLVAASVRFSDGRKDKNGYRKFIIRGPSAGNDLAMIAEAICRRYRSVSATDGLPDLLLIDGGKEQLKAAEEAIEKLGLPNVELLALSKEEGRHDRGLAAETLWHRSAGTITSVSLPESASELLFLQSIRDEAHRYTIQFQRKRESTKIRSSQLDGIFGIGPTKKSKLLNAFRGIEELKRSSVQEITAKAGLSAKDAAGILGALLGQNQLDGSPIPQGGKDFSG